MKVDLTDPVIHAITQARVKLLFTQPFFGQLSMRLELVDASEWCRSIATDGRNFYYNRDFIVGCTKEELLFVMGHEVLHCVYDQLGRRGNKNAQLWDMANDYIVNSTLINERVGSMPSGGLHDPAYHDELSSEEVYDLLVKNSAKVKMPLDMHLRHVGEGDEDGDGDGSTEVTIAGDGSGPPQLTEEEMQSIRDEIKADLIRTVQSVGAGKTPKGVLRLIDDFLEPKMDWRTLLDAHIRSSIKDDYTFQKIGRRTWGSSALGGRKFILPGQDYQNTIDIAIAIDASGSLSGPMLKDFMSEVVGIMESFKDFKIKLWSFDTQVYNYAEFSGENLQDIYSWSPGGGGGTSFECNFDYMRKNDIEPARFVMFTDGYPNNTWGDPDYCDTLFIIHGAPHITSPFGLTAHYESKN